MTVMWDESSLLHTTCAGLVVALVQLVLVVAMAVALQGNTNRRESSSNLSVASQTKPCPPSPGNAQFACDAYKWMHCGLLRALAKLCARTGRYMLRPAPSMLLCRHDTVVVNSDTAVGRNQHAQHNLNPGRSPPVPSPRCRAHRSTQSPS